MRGEHEGVAGVFNVLVHPIAFVSLGFSSEREREETYTETELSLAFAEKLVWSLCKILRGSLSVRVPVSNEASAQPEFGDASRLHSPFRTKENPL